MGSSASHIISRGGGEICTVSDPWQEFHEDLGAIGIEQAVAAKDAPKDFDSCFLPGWVRRCRKSSVAGRSSSKVHPLDIDISFVEPEREEKSATVSRDSETKKIPTTIRLVITKQQLAKMLADGSILASGTPMAQVQTKSSVDSNVSAARLTSTSMRLFNRAVEKNSFSSSCKQSWHPELDTILEVPEQ